MTSAENRTRSAYLTVSAVRFLSLFAGPGGAKSRSRRFVEVAADLGVSTATAGRLRTITALRTPSPRSCWAASRDGSASGGSCSRPAGSRAGKAAPLGR